MENQFLKVKDELRAYALKVENRIYKFSNSNEREFYFPRSNIYKSAIYDKNGRVIFTLLENNITLPTKNFEKYKEIVYYKKPLKPNIFKSSYLIVSKKLSYNKLIVNVIAILIAIAFLVFLATFFIIRASQEPYKKFNRYLENFIKDIYA